MQLLGYKMSDNSFTHKTPSSRFGNMDFYKKCIAIAAPVMLQQLIMGLVSLIDNFMVAGLGDIKMASVNVANQINFLFMVVIAVFFASGGIYLSQHNGAKNPPGMKQAFRFKVIFAVGTALIYMTVLLLIPDLVIKAMTNGNKEQAAISEYAVKYFRIIAFTCLPMAYSGAIGTSYREIGKARLPLIVAVIAGLINSFLNWLLIYGNMGAPRLEVEGAAIATVIARVVEMIILIICIKTKPQDFYVKTRHIFLIKASIFIEMIKKSSVIFFSEISWAASEILMTALYNSRGGAETVAGMAAGFTIANMFFLVFQGVHVATIVVVGGTLGAGDLDSAKVKARWILHGAVIAGIFIAIIEALSVFMIPFVFSNLTPEANKITIGLILLISAYMPLWSIIAAQFAVSRSGGDALFGVIVDIPVSLFLFAPIAIALAKYTSIGPVPMYGIAKLTDFIKVAIGFFMLKKEKWVRNLTDNIDL